MLIHCLLFPHLKADLAELSHPFAGDKPLVLIAGVGGNAAVTARSSIAADHGVLVGMGAAQARALSPRAVFLPDNGAQADAFLRRVAEAIEGAGAGVARPGRDYVAVHAGRWVTLGQVLGAASGVRGALDCLCKPGTGDSVKAALEDAHLARHLVLRPRPVTGATSLRRAG